MRDPILSGKFMHNPFEVEHDNIICESENREVFTRKHIENRLIIIYLSFADFYGAQFHQLQNWNYNIFSAYVTEL
jgi:hypothetical protein